LQSNQSATIENYVDETGKQQFGQSKFLKGPHNFFLHPGESCKIGNSRVISPGQILQIRAKEKFNDESGKTRLAGERWYVYGPTEFFCPISMWSFAI